MKDELISKLENVLQENYEFLKEKKLSFLEQAIEQGFYNYQETRMHPYWVLHIALEMYSPESLKEIESKLDELYDHEAFDHSMEINALIAAFNVLTKNSQKIFLDMMKAQDVNFLFENIEKVKENEKKEEFIEFLSTLLIHMERTKTSLEDNLFFLEFAYQANESEKKALNFFEGYVYLTNQMAVLNEKGYSFTLFEDDFIESVKNHYNNVVDYAKKLKNEKKKNQKKFRKKQEVCKNLLQKLKQVQSDYRMCTEDEIQYLPIDILEDLEKYYLTQNQSFYDKIQKELDLYNGNLEIQMKKLFEEYSYSFFQKEEYKKVILSYDMEEIREKLSILKSIFPCISEETLFSFLVLDLACLKILKVYLLTDVFSSSYVIEHISEFTMEHMIQIQKNMNYLKSYSINMKELNGILFMDESILEQNFQMLHVYKLSKEMFRYSFLPHFFDIADLWIEKGIYPYFEKNIEGMKNDLEMITKRILVALRMQIPLWNEDGFLSSNLLSENKFFIPNEQLDSYIGNVTPYSIQKDEKVLLDASDRKTLENLKEEPFYENELTYQIEDVLISRPKVLRNAYVTKEIDFNTYLYGSVFTLEECEKIKHGLEASLCLKRTEK